MEVPTLPRVLDIRAFVDARSAEVGSLLQGLQVQQGDKFGADALPRHLRRRATSYHRRRHQHRPNVRLAVFAKRRRLGTDASPVPDSDPTSTDRPTNRAMRRRPTCLVQCMQQDACPDLQLPEPGSQQPQGSGHQVRSAEERSVYQSPTSRRLETHVWHARRMRMHAPLWGHSLALHAAGRGHGSHALLQHLRTQCVIHDTSYWGCLALGGHQKDITHILELCSDPTLLQQQLDRSEVFCGAAEWTLSFHAPSSAGSSPPASLAPARALWVPSGSDECGGGEGKASGRLQNTGADGAGEEEWYRDCSLWLWVHPAAFRDCAEALLSARASLGLTERVAIQNLSQQLRRIEVVGRQAGWCLGAVLQPAPEAVSHTGSRVWSSVTHHTAQQQAPEQAGTSGGGMRAPAAPSVRGPRDLRWAWPPGCVVGLTVMDPRLTRPVAVSGATLPVPSGILGSTTPPLEAVPQSVTELKQLLRQWPEGGDWTDGAHTLLRHSCEADGSDSSSAPASHPLPAPHTDEAVGQLRRAARLAALSLPPSSSQANGSTQSASTCPVLLVHRGTCQSDLQHWSVILPPGWVPPFWQALTHRGARAAGLAEWRWVCSQLGVPCFPWDYPHTPAWQRTMTSVAASQAAWAQRRPAGRLPMPPVLLPYIPWQYLGGRDEEFRLGEPWSHASMGLVCGKKPQAGSTSAAAQARPLGEGWQVACTHGQVSEVMRQALGGCTDLKGSERGRFSSSVHSTDGEPAVLQRQWLVWVWVRVVGKGRCIEGAQLLWSPACSASLLGCHQESREGDAVEDPASVTVLGYVTSSGPAHGLTAIRAPAGPCHRPCGLAVVCAQSLAQALAHKYERRSGGSGVVYRSVRLMLRNPGSQTVRAADVQLVLTQELAGT